MEKNKKKGATSILVQIIALVVIVAVLGTIVLAIASPGLRARYYAWQIGEGGSNGPATQKIISYGADIAIPIALDKMKSKDYVARRYGIFILNNLPSADRDKITAHIGEIMADAVKDDHEHNRILYCQMITNLYVAQRQHCGKMVPFLKDESPTVRKVACASIQRIGDIDILGKDASFWLDWWEKEKLTLQEKGVKVPTVELPSK